MSAVLLRRINYPCPRHSEQPRGRNKLNSRVIREDLSLSIKREMESDHPEGGPQRLVLGLLRSRRARSMSNVFCYFSSPEK